MSAAIFLRRLLRPWLPRDGGQCSPSQYRYRQPGGPALGPADATRLRAMLADGRLDEHTQVAAIDTDDWRPVSTLLGESLVRSLGSPP